MVNFFPGNQSVAMLKIKISHTLLPNPLLVYPREVFMGVISWLMQYCSSVICATGRYIMKSTYLYFALLGDTSRRMPLA